MQIQIFCWKNLKDFLMRFSLIISKLFLTYSEFFLYTTTPLYWQLFDCLIVWLFDCLTVWLFDCLIYSDVAIIQWNDVSMMVVFLMMVVLNDDSKYFSKHICDWTKDERTSIWRIEKSNFQPWFTYNYINLILPRKFM